MGTDAEEGGREGGREREWGDQENSGWKGLKIANERALLKFEA
jgi:hypothetical protein